MNSMKTIEEILKQEKPNCSNIESLEKQYIQNLKEQWYNMGVHDGFIYALKQRTQDLLILKNDPEIRELLIDILGVEREKKVYQYTKTGEFIAEYSSISEASRRTGTPQKAIMTVCGGKKQFANAYRWSFEKHEVFFGVNEEPPKGFKYIPGFEGLYSISRDGVVYGHRSKKILAPKDGVIGLSHPTHRQVQNKTIAYLLALTYIPNPNPENFKHVKFLDSNPLNLNVDNIVWCKTKIRLVLGRRVKQFSLDGELKREWNTALEAAVSLDINVGSLYSCLNGKRGRKTAGGYIWRYSEKEDISKKENTETTKNKVSNEVEEVLDDVKIYLYVTETGKFITEYSSISEASIETGISIKEIKAICDNSLSSRGYKYTFRYTSEALPIDLPPEGFKYIPGFEGQYSVSRDGRVYGHKQKKLLKPIIRTTGEYLSLNKLDSSGEIIKRNTYCLAYLIALAYIPNPEKFKYVKQLDGDPHNNNVDNLAWFKTRFVIQTRKVKQFALDGTFIKEWKSTHDAALSLNINNSSINSCLKGKSKKSGGYIWKYSDEEEE